jgi:hypothetical protein
MIKKYSLERMIYMTTDVILDLLKTFGLPTALLFGLAFFVIKYINKKDNENREDTKEQIQHVREDAKEQIKVLREEHNEDRVLFREAIDNFQIAVQEFKNSQQETVSIKGDLVEVKGDLVEVKQDLLVIKTKMEK